VECVRNFGTLATRATNRTFLSVVCYRLVTTWVATNNEYTNHLKITILSLFYYFIMRHLVCVTFSQLITLMELHRGTRTMSIV